MKAYSFLSAAVAMIMPLSGQPEADVPPTDRIQIALLLDTSNSMDGLIDQTRTQLWKVVNTFIDARRNGVAQHVEVALFEYGNNSLHAGNHYIRLVEPLSRDMDELSRELFELKTNGGNEYCGAVIQRALADLSWDQSPETYKAVFIAGNEPFTQGPVDASEACSSASSKSVVVNTIHCGTMQAGIAGSWNDGAALAGGRYVVIDQNRAVPHIDAPQDAEIARLGLKLNETYLGYGKGWGASAQSQVKADRDAVANAASGAAVQRSLCKARHNYGNAKWDLVDAMKELKVDPGSIPAAELPEEMGKMDAAARVDHVRKAASKRAEIQAQIVRLNREREKFLAEARKRKAEADGQTLDEALVLVAREQAIALGYEFGR